jgi:hypothetical protein
VREALGHQVHCLQNLERPNLENAILRGNSQVEILF